MKKPDLNAFITLLQEGQQLDNPAVWKNRQLLGNHLIALLAGGAALASSLGYSLPLTPDQLTGLGGAIATAVSIANSILTVTTSEKIGLKPQAQPPAPTQN